MAELRNIVFSILILSLVFLVLFGAYANLYDTYQDYGATTSNYLNNTHDYDKTTQVNDMMQEIKEKVYNTSITSGDATDFSIKSSYSSVRNLMSGGFSMIELVTYKFQEQLNIPTYIRTIFILFITTMILFAIISGFLQNRW